MGGKSTLLRQTCLAALLAHVGAWVPAESLRLSPVDALFVRMGGVCSISGTACMMAAPRALAAHDVQTRFSSAATTWVRPHFYINTAAMTMRVLRQRGTTSSAGSRPSCWSCPRRLHC